MYLCVVVLKNFIFFKIVVMKNQLALETHQDGFSPLNLETNALFGWRMKSERQKTKKTITCVWLM